MSGNALQFSTGVGAISGSGSSAAAVVPESVRGDSEVRVGFARAGADTKLVTSFERGSMRVRLPRRNGAAEAVLVNTGGGITGGDRVSIALAVEARAHVVSTSQAAERIYRTDGPPARIGLCIEIAPGARLDWMPQETILFDGAAAERSMCVEVSGAATLTLLEIVVLGRIAHGERISRGSWRDRWRIRRDGRLLLAEDVRIEAAIADLAERPAIGAGARCLATLVHIDGAAEKRIEAVRERLAAARSTAAASAWDGVLVARFASVDPGAVRADAIAVATYLTGEPMPRAWSC